MPHSAGVIAASSGGVVLEANVITLTVGGTHVKSSSFDGFNKNPQNTLSDEGAENLTFGAVSPGAVTVNDVDFPIETMMRTSGGMTRTELFLEDEDELLDTNSIVSMSSTLGTVVKSSFTHTGSVAKYQFGTTPDIFGTVEGSTIVVTVTVAS